MSETIWKGASVLLLEEDAPIFALKIKHDACILTGIGGKVEEGESFRECAIRETLEETAIDLTIIDSEKCLIVDFEGKTSAAESITGAIARIHKAAKSPQGKPWDFSLSEQKLVVEMFLGRLDKAPKAIEKHPAFLTIEPAKLPDVLQHGIDLEQAQVEKTIRIVGGRLPDNLPSRAYIADSLEALFIALEDDLEQFLMRAKNIWGGQ